MAYFDMAWQVEGTDEFAEWFLELNEDEDRSMSAGSSSCWLSTGRRCPSRISSGIVGSRHRHMRELRIQHRGRPYRVLYAFDPGERQSCSSAGTRPENDRWYEENIPVADDRYDDTWAS